MSKKNNKKWPVADLDFNSEYPNSIVTKNILKETKTQEKDSNIIIDDLICIGKRRIIYTSIACYR